MYELVFANFVLHKYLEVNKKELTWSLRFFRSELLSEVHDWLKTIPSLQLEPVKCGSISLDDPVVEAIEQVVLSTKV